MTETIMTSKTSNTGSIAKIHLDLPKYFETGGKNMKYGKLIYNGEFNRLYVLLDNDSTLGGLHCGDCLEVMLDNKWIPARVEYDEDWYLSGICLGGRIPVGLSVRVCA